LSEEIPKDSTKKKSRRSKGSKNKTTGELPKKTKREKSKSVTKPEKKLTAGQVAELVEAQAKAAQARSSAAKSEAEAAAEAEYKAAAAAATTTQVSESFTDKYRQDRIFRREMGEPEFWMGKEGLVPPRPILSSDEEKKTWERAMQPQDQTPQYKPENILSPEFAGTSNYERGIGDFTQELEEKLEKLKLDPESNPEKINKTQEDLKTLDYLYENFYLGMNVFRTAKGGRAKLRE